MPSRIRLDRAELSKIVGGNAKWIRAFEEMFDESVELTPATLAIVQSLAYAAQGLAQDARAAAAEAHQAADDARSALATLPDESQRLSDLEGLVASVQALALSLSQEDSGEVLGEFYAEAAENITGPAVVDVFDDSGTDKVRNAIADTSAYECVGFVLSSYTTGQMARVFTLGNITGLSSLTTGAYYYLSDVTAGAVTVTAPTTVGHVVQNVGRAVSPTVLAFKPIPGVFIV